MALTHARLIVHLLLLKHVLILQLLDLVSLLLGHLAVLHLHLRLLDGLGVTSCADRPRGLVGNQGRNLLYRGLVRWLTHLVRLRLQVHHLELLGLLSSRRITVDLLIAGVAKGARLKLLLIHSSFFIQINVNNN